MSSFAESPYFLLPRNAMGRALVFLLLLTTFDAFAKTDTPVTIASVLFFAAALYRRAWAYVPVASLLLFLFPVAHFYPDWVWRVPTAGFFVPLALSALCCLPFARLRPSFRWFRKGELDQVTWLLVALTSLVSALALILWALWTDYFGVSSQMLAPLKTTPRWINLLVFVPGFAILNAAAEEMVYRGVIQGALEEDWALAKWPLLFLQASAFAAAHYRFGFPNGKVGYAMVFIYALMLGWLRRRTNGMWAPYVAHVAADTVIGVTLVMLVS